MSHHHGHKDQHDHNHNHTCSCGCGCCSEEEYEDLEEEYDMSLAIGNLKWSKANLDEYMSCVVGNEYWFNDKFVSYLKDGDYAW